MRYVEQHKSYTPLVEMWLVKSILEIFGKKYISQDSEILHVRITLKKPWDMYIKKIHKTDENSNIYAKGTQEAPLNWTT